MIVDPVKCHVSRVLNMRCAARPPGNSGMDSNQGGWKALNLQPSIKMSSYAISRRNQGPTIADSSLEVTGIHPRIKLSSGTPGAWFPPCVLPPSRRWPPSQLWSYGWIILGC